MASQDQGSHQSIELEEIIDPHSRREAIWLWLCLQRNWRAEFTPDSCNGDSMIPVLNSHLKSLSHRYADRIRRTKDRNLLPERHIDWIKDDHRQLTYLKSQMKEVPTLEDLPRLDGRTLIIAELDHWDVKLSDKKSFIFKTMQGWEEKKKIADQCRWLMTGEETIQKLQHTIRWIDDNRSKVGITRNARLADSATLENLLIFFDEAELRPLEVRNIIASVRGSWNKQKYRERNTGKSQMNVMLPNTTIKALDDLAEAHGLKRPAIIERLITLERQCGQYLDPRKD
ncbi:hypothetical protein VF673_03365 [Halopseudomonas sp. Lyrl_26]|uniref:hypothetical protein n=1 Tax=Halopseudomonas sp. Lyrl_26 TaxID=3110923 RepID=UPI003F81BFBD